MGAALATHAVADLTKEGYSIGEFYSLGSPRVGGAEFMKWFNKNIFRGFRIVNMKDPVPHLPPYYPKSSILSFEHLPTEVWYPTGYDGGPKVCSGVNGEDPTCSDSIKDT